MRREAVDRFDRDRVFGGTGNILGAEQSGHIAAVGFDLYTQLMEEAVASIKGEEVRTEFEPDIELPLPAKA